ncbi:MAG: DUF2497 domain-containing protein, partial [Planctomycetales bacterium]|nr:DUF2497 domain-containing protein [Planctomycetales bacterium]
SREKIHRTRATETLAKDYGPRTASFNPPQSAPSEAPRRSWRDLEPAPPLRPTVVEHDYAPAPIRQEHRVPREVLHVAEAVQPPAESWHDEQRTSLPPPVRERHHQVESAMMSGETAEAVQLAFGRLSESLLSRAGGGRSIEEITRELLRGMLKQWLDENLPQLVEQMVREEIERVARTGR